MEYNTLLLIRNKKMKISKIIYNILFLGVTITFMSIDSAAADKLCLYNQISENSSIKDSQCPNMDSASGLYLSWVSEINAAKGIPSMIRLDGTYYGNKFSIEDKYLNYNPATSSDDALSLNGDNIDFEGEPLIPVKSSVMDQLNETVYSAEERSRFNRNNNGFSLTCKAGNRPAGLILTPALGKFPDGAGYVISVHGRASQPLKMGLSPKNGVLSNDDGYFPKYSGTGNNQDYDTFRIESHAQNNDQIVIQCPSGNASLDIADIQIELKDDASSNQALSTWIWRKQVWMQFSDSWLDWAQSIGLTKAYIQIDIEDDAIADENSLARFIVDARKKNIDVFAVEGDPQMISGEGQKSALRRTQIIKNFQNSLPENAKLAGIQYDIEPYSVPALNTNPTKMWADWSSTLTAMQKIWDAPIDIVVPYWLQNTSEAMTALQAVKNLGSFTIMAYRSNPYELYDISMPWLVWGNTVNAKITIAVENAPVDGSAHLFFAPFPNNELDNYSTRIFLMSGADKSRVKKAYKLIDIEQPNNRISFLKNMSNLRSALATLYPYFRSYQSFNGIAVHGLR